jgi:protein SCO1/2
MNREAMSKALISALALAATLTACSSEPAAVADEPVQRGIAGANIGGPFELVDPSGNTVRWEDFDGQYRIVYFGYAYCPDVCPYDVQYMAKAVDLFEDRHPDKADKVVPIFITIDPERDTPEVVGEFINAFSDRLVGLTGTQEQVDAAAKAFGAYYTKGETQPGGGYLMDHSRATYLMGPEGEPVALLSIEKGAETVTAELEQWVQ